MTLSSWSELSARKERTDLPHILVHNLDSIRREDLPRALHQSWIMPEWPTRLVEPELWDVIFHRVLDEGQYLHEDAPSPITELPDQLILFRAAAKGHERGMSWTSSFKRAYWFLTRFGDNIARHRLFIVTATPSMVWAHFNEQRAENEYVLKSDSLGESDMEEVYPDEWAYLLESEETDQFNVSKESADASA